MVNLVVQNFLENKNLYNKIYEDLRKDLDESIPINHVGAKSEYITKLIERANITY